MNQCEWCDDVCLVLDSLLLGGYVGQRDGDGRGRVVDRDLNRPAEDGNCFGNNPRPGGLIGNVCDDHTGCDAVGLAPSLDGVQAGRVVLGLAERAGDQYDVGPFGCESPSDPGSDSTTGPGHDRPSPFKCPGHAARAYSMSNDDPHGA